MIASPAGKSRLDGVNKWELTCPEEVLGNEPNGETTAICFGVFRSESGVIILSWIF